MTDRRHFYSGGREKSNAGNGSDSDQELLFCWDLPSAMSAQREKLDVFFWPASVSSPCLQSRAGDGARAPSIQWSVLSKWTSAQMRSGRRQPFKFGISFAALFLPTHFPISKS